MVTTNFDFEAYGGLNQADHRAAGMAVVDGVRDADNPWVFREPVDEEGLAPWHTTALLVAGHELGTHAVTVDEAAVTAAVASLNRHEAYLQHVTGHPRPEEFIPEILRNGGEHSGSDYAVPFRLFDLGGIGS